jgi:hypothetical protein
MSQNVPSHLCPLKAAESFCSPPSASHFQTPVCLPACLSVVSLFSAPGLSPTPRWVGGGSVKMAPLEGNVPGLLSTHGGWELVGKYYSFPSGERGWLWG